MEFIKLSDSTWPHTLDQVRQSALPTLLPTDVEHIDLAEAGFARIAEVPPPSCDELTHEVQAGSVELLDGVWTRTWLLVPLDAAVIAERSAAAASASAYSLRYGLKSHLDVRAMERDWDTIDSAMNRAGYEGPYQAEGLAYAQWADACWLVYYAVVAGCNAGTRDWPTTDAMLAELPALALPARV